MTAPVLPIDADLGEWDKISYFPSEASAIWRAQNLGGGNATWTALWAATSFDPNLGTGFVLDRIRCAPGSTLPIVYAIGHALKPGGANYAEFCGRSQNNGLTWHWREIGDIEDVTDVSFSLGAVTSADGPQSHATFSGGAGQVTCDVHFWIRTDSQSQWTQTVAAVDMVFGATLPTGTLSLEYDVIGTYPSSDYNTNGDMPPYFRGAGGTFTPGGNGGHFSGTISIPPNTTTLNLGWWSSGGGSAGRWALDNESIRSCVVTNIVIGGVPCGAGANKAFDVYRGNSNVLFYGSTDNIFTSIDSGYSWQTLPANEGATDICIDPLLGGVIYYWCVDGNFKQAIADITPTVLQSGAIKQNNFLTIARDFTSGDLWIIDPSGNLKKRHLGSWSTQKTGLVGGCGLRAYYASPTKLVCLDESNIYLSLDAGGTWTAKKGGWSAYAAPRTIHLLGTE